MSSLVMKNLCFSPACVLFFSCKESAVQYRMPMLVHVTKKECEEEDSAVPNHQLRSKNLLVKIDPSQPHS